MVAAVSRARQQPLLILVNPSAFTFVESPVRNSCSTKEAFGPIFPVQWSLRLLSGLVLGSYPVSQSRSLRCHVTFFDFLVETATLDVNQMSHWGITAGSISRALLMSGLHVDTIRWYLPG
jgi:hypothetical protein